MEKDVHETLAEGFEFVEAPRVSPEGDVWFSDLTGGGVYRKPPGQDVETMLQGRLWVGGIVFDRSGAVLCSGKGGIVALNPETGAVKTVLDTLDGKPIVAVNDMEGDGRGGFFAGTIDFDAILARGEAPEPGQFFHMDAAGRITILRRDVFATNGIALSPCGRWLYHSETSRGIWRYTMDDDGLPGEGILLAPFEDSDGLALDAEGCLWVACWASGTLVRISADGERLGTFHYGFPHLVSLAFDSADPRCLYVSTGGNAEKPAMGGIIAVNLDVEGLCGAPTSLDMLEKA
ncbi:SMP-30/gluconolactonase/LRE family protein [Croceicoccus sediminis]|uniref:SMP-30/gluconolactonase/LRE family protein n=1 Tax=Croceicoccus sediminis TaxID=2571150 RepID=UPI001182D875|nr:SMP-30/gluconolactonase/LRE family protein [Croceicoccus sediminis]